MGGVRQSYSFIFTVLSRHFRYLKCVIFMTSTIYLLGLHRETAVTLGLIKKGRAPECNRFAVAVIAYSKVTIWIYVALQVDTLAVTSNP